MRGRCVPSMMIRSVVARLQDTFEIFGGAVAAWAVASKTQIIIIVIATVIIIIVTSSITSVIVITAAAATTIAIIVRSRSRRPNETRGGGEAAGGGRGGGGGGAGLRRETQTDEQGICEAEKTFRKKRAKRTSPQWFWPKLIGQAHVPPCKLLPTDAGRHGLQQQSAVCLGAARCACWPDAVFPAAPPAQAPGP